MNKLTISTWGISYSAPCNCGITGFWNMPEGFLTVSGWFQVFCKGKIEFK